MEKLNFNLLKQLIIIFGDLIIMMGVACSAYLVNIYFDTGREFYVFIFILVVLYLRLWFKI